MFFDPDIDEPTVLRFLSGDVVDFEKVFQEAKAERENVAAIQEDFLKRSFNALPSQAEAGIIAADEEVERGVHGAEGRLRKAELPKEQHEQRRRQRLKRDRTLAPAA